MAKVLMIVKYGKGSTPVEMQAAVGRAWPHWMRKSLAAIERHFVRNEWVPGGGKVNPKDPHPYKLTVRSGALRRSYTRRMIDKHIGGFGSDLVYSAIHEFGGLAGRGRKTRIPARPTVQRTADATAAEIEKIMAESLAKEGL